VPKEQTIKKQYTKHNRSRRYCLIPILLNNKELDIFFSFRIFRQKKEKWRKKLQNCNQEKTANPWYFLAWLSYLTANSHIWLPTMIIYGRECSSSVPLGTELLFVCSRRGAKESSTDLRRLSQMRDICWFDR
jgi:hypothetical protein